MAQQACSPFRISSAGGPPSIPMRLISTLSLVLFASFGWAIWTRSGVLAERQVQNRPIQVPAAGYTSSETCRACHPSQYASWHDSYHRTMTQVATPRSVVADFNGTTIADVHGRPMRLSKRGDRFFAEFDDPDWDGQGENAPRIEREVVMITGSHHQQIYWYPTGRHRLLGQLPGAYLIAERRWIPRRMAVLSPPTDPVFSESGHWNSTCIACHATQGKPEFDTPFGSRPLEEQTIETTATEFGIACEACHGPGESHVRQNRSPLRRYGFHLGGAADDTTVQPVRLDPRKSSQVCGQCHGIWEFYDERGERQANSAGMPYRPGDELAETRFVAQPTRNLESPTMRTLLESDAGFVRDSFWSDGKVRVSGREYNGLIESPCFKDATEASRTLACTSCHTLHRTADDRRPAKEWANDQLSAHAQGNEACAQCHAPIQANLTAHTKHGADSAGSSCYNCHMPYTTYGLLKTIRSHTVSTPSVRESIEHGRPNACNLCHLDKTLQWTSDALAKWYGTTPPVLADDDRQVSAGVLWVLRGDAGQRAIAAQAMAWQPAQQAAGATWMAPYLAQLLDDPYDAVRFIAGRSIATLPGFTGFPYDFVSGPRARRDAQRRAMAIWDRERQVGPRTDQPLLVDERGGLKVDAVLRLIAARDNTRVFLRE